MPIPALFKPYQVDALGWALARPASMLAMDMGLGKTLVALTAARILLDAGEVKQVLVIAPRMVAQETWPAEILKWSHTAHLPFIVAPLGDGASLAQAARDLKTGATITILGIKNIVWLVKWLSENRIRWPFDFLILDESSLYKDSSTKRFKALKAIRKRVRRMLLLSGTPISAGLLDIWAQMFLMDGGSRLGTAYSRFRDTYFTSDYMGYNFEIRPDQEQPVLSRVSELAISMRAKNLLDMPRLTVQDIRVHLSSSQTHDYVAFARKSIAHYPDGVVLAQNAAVLAGKLCQYANGFMYNTDRKPVFLHQLKMDMLGEILECQVADGNVLLFYYFQEDFQRIMSRFPYAVDLKAPGAVEAWNAGQIKLLVAHPQSGGYGLNLQFGGNYIVWYSLPPGKLQLYLQAIARLHRHGQTKPVFVYRLLTVGTADEGIAQDMDELRDGLESFLHSIQNLRR